MVSERPIRILIVDDHPVFRFGLRALLESQQDMEVAGEAENGFEAVHLAETLKPELVLMDVNMAGMNGIEATRQITGRVPETAVLIMTMLDDDTVFLAIQAGARGYLLKGAQGLETIRAIRAVANGEVIFSPGVAEQMLYYFRGKQKITSQNAFPELTSREREILQLLAQGLTNKAIADKLFLSPKTIRNNNSIIFSKLQVVGRNEAIIKAREAGLGK